MAGTNIGIPLDGLSRNPTESKYVELGAYNDAPVVVSGKVDTRAYGLKVGTGIFFIGMASLITTLAKGLNVIIASEQAQPLLGALGSFFCAIVFAVAVFLSYHAHTLSGGLTLLGEYLLPRFREQYGGWGWSFLAVLLYWISGFGFSLIGAWLLWELQANNAVTHAGRPTIDTTAGRAFAMEFVPIVFLTWASLTLNDRAKLEKFSHHLITAGALAMLHGALQFFAYFYTNGSFGFIHWLTTSIVSGEFQDHWWIYLLADVFALILGFILHVTFTMGWTKVFSRKPKNE